MVDHVVDTNVLLVASAAIEPRYPDVPADSDEIEDVYDWLREFRDDSCRQMVLDEFFKIVEEYQNKLTWQHFGLLVVQKKLEQSCFRQVPVSYDENGHGVVPPALAAIDNSDKKFVAAALNDPSGIHIVNATDSDWRQHREVLQQHGVQVLELLP